MPETKSPTADLPEPDENACTCIMVGHAISVLDDEASVCIDVNGRSARLSVAGARIVAAQIVQWADHAEERNKTRPTARLMKSIYRVVEKTAKTPSAVPEEPKMEWRSLDPENEESDDAFRQGLAQNVAAITPAPGEIHIPLRRVRNAKRPAKKTARKGKRK